MKFLGGAGAVFSFLPLVLGDGECSAPCMGHFTPGQQSLVHTRVSLVRAVQ